MEEKLHTPEGVRDIYSRECEIKLTLQKKLNQVLHLYGYEDIQTPTFEYYDVFREEIGSTSTQELYKFFDRDGNILSEPCFFFRYLFDGMNIDRMDVFVKIEKILL